MLSQHDIKQKLKIIWEKQSLQKAYIKEENIFPIIISLPKLSAKLLQQGFALIKNAIKNLVDNSKQKKSFGYQIIFQEINHRQLGVQTIPVQIEFHELDDFLLFTDKKRDFQKFCEMVTYVLNKESQLKSWLLQHPKCILEYQEKWPRLLQICQFLRNNPKPGCYLRELSIADVDTKWIEQHKKILSELLDQLLPPETINQTAIKGAYYFEQRYGFKHDEQLIRFRILDKKLLSFIKPQIFFPDITLPLSQFQKIQINCKKVFITENKINGLSFPPISDAIVIFGLGYGIQSLNKIDWLQDKEIIYWGDIDTHGFAMLSQLRSYYPQVQSFLMDEATLQRFKSLWVQEPMDKRCKAQLNHLFPEELMVYLKLKENILGENVRLEQERIYFGYFCERLDGLYMAKRSSKAQSSVSLTSNIFQQAVK